MECVGWCVTNETLTHIALLEGALIIVLGVWLFVLDGRLVQLDLYIKRMKKLGRAPIEAKDARMREAQAQEKYGIDYGE